MKVLIFISLVCLSFPSYSQTITPEEKEQIKAAVRTWVLSKTLKDPGSYKSDSFYDFEPVVDLSGEAEEAYQKWIKDEHSALVTFFSDTASTQTNFSDSTKQSVLKLEKDYHSFEKEHIGYKVKHKFRAKDRRDNPLFYETEFVLDRQFKIRETSVKERMQSVEKTG